jgi:hypothetical protein
MRYQSQIRVRDTGGISFNVVSNTFPTEIDRDQTWIPGIDQSQLAAHHAPSPCDHEVLTAWS